MQYIEYVDVDDEVANDLWQKICDAPGFYSIADGVSKEHFFQVLYNSDFVVKMQGGFVRGEIDDEFVELHPIVLGVSFLAAAKYALNELYETSRKRFQNRKICCIIPTRMRGARMLAKAVGMELLGECVRGFSGSAIECGIYIWRHDNGV